MRDLAIADRMQVAGRVGPVLVFGRRDHRPAPRAIARRQLVAETGPEDRPPARRPVELLVALERIVHAVDAAVGADADHLVVVRVNADQAAGERSEERRGGKECVSTFKSGWSPSYST